VRLNLKIINCCMCTFIGGPRVRPESSCVKRQKVQPQLCELATAMANTPHLTSKNNTNYIMSNS